MKLKFTYFHVLVDFVYKEYAAKLIKYILNIQTILTSSILK